MKKRISGRNRKQTAISRAALILAVSLVAVIGGLKFIEPTEAATPASGDFSPTGPTAPFTGSWTGDKPGLPPAANGEPTCSTGDASATNCDVFALNITGTTGDWAGKQIRIKFNWTLVATDYDMVVRKETNGVPGFQGDGVGADTSNLDGVVGTSGRGTSTEEEVVISPAESGVGVYYVRALYYTASVADQYTGSVSISTPPAGPPPSACAAPTFDNYQPPVGYPRRDDSGEPSIGVNWNTGNIMTMSRLQANRTTFNDSTSPADPLTARWFNQTSPLIVTGLDPIGFTDSVTGRSIFGELSGNFTNAVISDDDLTTAQPNLQAVGSASAVDHQSIAGGPPRPGVIGRQPLTGYPHLFYYAAQNIAYATVATSFDGGLTYQPAIPAYTLAQCNGLHGHLKVAPDGTVYLPNKGCGGKTGIVVSEDNGLNWSVRVIPTSTSGSTDPSVGTAANGRIYVSYVAADNHPHVAVSDDRGLTWRDDFDLGLSVAPNLRAAVFPAAVAGDYNRAAVFFLATDSTNPGDPTGTDNDGNGPNFAGTWYPYMATTCDGGKSWSVVKADNDPLHPGMKNPVQQGVVCTNGTTCPGGPPDTRNLLDFNDLTVDSRGRILAVYADGCNFDHSCISQTDNDPTMTTRIQNQGTARLTIIRQRGGMRLFGAFDPGGPTPPPLAPPAWIESNLQLGNQIKWATPNDGGSPLKSYRIYRGVRGQQGETLVAEVAANVNAYRDRKIKGRTTGVYYHVTAVNKYGESSKAAKLFANLKGE